MVGDDSYKIDLLDPEIYPVWKSYRSWIIKVYHPIMPKATIAKLIDTHLATLGLVRTYTPHEHFITGDKDAVIAWMLSHA